MEEKAKVGYTLGELVGMLVVVFLVGFGAGMLVDWWIGNKHSASVSVEPAKIGSAVEVEDKLENSTFSVYVKDNFLLIAEYKDFLNGDAYLSYKNINDDNVTVMINTESHSIIRVYVSNSHTEYTGNCDVCKEAGKAVVYWKSIMKWDERVKRVLEERAKQKPEEELD